MKQGRLFRSPLAIKFAHYSSSSLKSKQRKEEEKAFLFQNS